MATSFLPLDIVSKRAVIACVHVYLLELGLGMCVVKDDSGCESRGEKRKSMQFKNTESTLRGDATQSRRYEEGP